MRWIALDATSDAFDFSVFQPSLAESCVNLTFCEEPEISSLLSSLVILWTTNAESPKPNLRRPAQAYTVTFDSNHETYAE